MIFTLEVTKEHLYKEQLYNSESAVCRRSSNVIVYSYIQLITTVDAQLYWFL